MSAATGLRRKCGISSAGNDEYGININSDLSLSWGYMKLIKEKIDETDMVQGEYYGPSPSFYEIIANNCKNKNNCITIPNDWYEN